MRNTQGKIVVAVSSLAIYALGLPATAQAQERVSGKEASISANGRATIKQDRGWVEIYVTAEDKEPGTALANHATSLKTVLDQVAAKGFSGASVEAGLLAIRPRFEVKREGTREIRGPLIGYAVTKPVYVFIDKTEQVAAFVAGFPMSGPVRIGNVGFYANDAALAQNASITDGITRAQAAGTIAARATNRKIGAVSGIRLHLNDRFVTRPRVATLQNWQNLASNIQNDDALSTRLVLEPGEEAIQQQISLELQLR